LLPVFLIVILAVRTLLVNTIITSETEMKGDLFKLPEASTKLDLFQADWSDEALITM
jgi:hypothetical protein